MRTLYQKFETLLQSTTTDFKRYLYRSVAWESRMIGIIGARGVGKTTMILQHIKENLDIDILSDLKVQRFPSIIQTD